MIATGIGSLPGVDSAEATRTVAGELPDLPHLVELPARGPGADMVGRAMGMVAAETGDFAVETTPIGWRVADAPGRTMRRAWSWLGEDLDAAEESYAGAPAVKAQVCGPWTLAAAVELASGERIVRDPGARRELGEALAEAVGAQVAEIGRRIPGARVWLQVDEPGLPAVLRGGVPTASGLATYRAISASEAAAGLRRVAEAIAGAGGRPVVHCCAAGAPLDLLAEAGFDGLALPLAHADDTVPRVLEAGRPALLGVVAPLGLAGVRADTPIGAIAEPAARALLTRLGEWGLALDSVAEGLVVTPDCGLAGVDPTRARLAYAVLREIVRLVGDDEEPEATDAEGVDRRRR